jgi:hypothetical protein
VVDKREKRVRVRWNIREIDEREECFGDFSFLIQARGEERVKRAERERDSIKYEAALILGRKQKLKKLIAKSN